MTHNRITPKIGGFILITIIAIVCASFLFACTPQPQKLGDFYSLEEAYEQGLLTVDDLKSIAYYQNGSTDDPDFVPAPKTPEALSAETAAAIKETKAYDLREEIYAHEEELRKAGRLDKNSLDNPQKKAIADQVTIEKYYGTYNDCVVVMYTDYFHCYNCAIWEIEVGGVRFIYSNGNRISVWKQR